MKFKIKTKGFNDVINITQKISQIVEDSKIDNGIVSVFVLGSTAGITAIEYEKGVIEDLKEAFERIAPQEAKYNHEAAWQDGNGYAHVRAALLKPSLIIPIENGKMLLGRWQQIVLIDFDNKEREREIIINIVNAN
jgi:secondary thiamine-phosphate synthase enzyme